MRCLLRGNGQHRRHFHGEFEGRYTGFGGSGEQARRFQSESGTPQRRTRQKDKPAFAHVGQSTLACEWLGQGLTQTLVERSQGTGAVDQAVES